MSCTGKPGLLRGKVLSEVTVGGLIPVTRSFIYYVPESLDPNKGVPLIISPHGFGMTAEDMFTLTGFREVADREGLVAIFPDGSPVAPWNVGTGASGIGANVNNILADDQGFFDAIIAFASADQCVDAKHMFVSGFSMGGYLSNEVDCLRSDIAGVGAHSAGSHDLSQCPGSIKPVILFHGDADLVIGYKDNGELARDRWVTRNGCTQVAEARPVKGGTCEYYRGCPAHAQVALCRFDGMAHLWAGGSGLHGDPSRESAADLAWSFWRQYAW